MLRVEIIKDIPLFSGLTEAQAAAVAREAELVGLDGPAESASERLPAGHILFDAGMPVDGVYFALDLKRRPAPAPIFVRLEIPTPPPGKPVRLERVDEGKLFGEAEFFQAGLIAQGFRPEGAVASPSHRKRETRAVLITPASVVRVPIATLARIVDETPRVRQKLVALSARRLKDALSSQLRGRNLDGDANLADHLMRLAEDFGRYVGNYAVFAEKISQADIAADLGIGRRALTDRLQAWTEAGLIRTTPLTLLDVRRIEQLRKVGVEEPVVLIEDTVRKIRQMIDAGDLHAARAMSIDIGKFFPASPALAFMGALAAARSGRPADAEAILDAAALLSADPDTLHRRVTLGLVRPASAIAETVPEGPDFDDLVAEALGGDADDEVARLKPTASEWTREILALRGRIAKDRALASGDQAQAKLAAERYLETDRFQSRGDPFPAINAASLLVMAGDRKAGETLARRVIGAATSSDYWTLSSVAEAHLIVGDAKAALATVQRAMEAPHSDGMAASTRRQLRRMAPVLGNVEPILDLLTVRRPIVYSGTMMRPDQFDNVAAVEAHAKAAIEALLAEDRIGAAYGALARGADIVIAEALVEAGIELNVVLPFDDADFIAQSVAIGGDDDGWTERFNDLINRCSSVTIAQPGSPQARDLDMSFRHGFRMAGALAAERAAFLETTPLLVAMTIVDQHRGVAGTGGDVADWEQSGREVQRIELPFARTRAPKPGAMRHGFSATLFYFPSEGDEGEAEAVLARLTRKLRLEDVKILPRKIKGGRTGAAATLASVGDTLQLAFALHDADGKTGRVICDYGPVFGRSGNVDTEALARMAGAADFTGFAADRVLAAAPFAAEVIFSRTPGVSAVAAGQRAYRATERGRLRIIPASGVYELVAE